MKKLFNVCWNQETLNSADFPANTPINFLIYVSWKGAAEATMAITYEVTVTEPILANVTASTNSVDVNQSVVLDSRGTQF